MVQLTVVVFCSSLRNSASFQRGRRSICQSFAYRQVCLEIVQVAQSAMGVRDPAHERHVISTEVQSDFVDTTIPRVRRRSPSVDGSELRKRRRGSSPNNQYEPSIPRRSSYGGSGVGMRSDRGYGNGYNSGNPISPPSASQAYARSMGNTPLGQPANRSRRLYVGNLPSHVGLDENALQQFFSALYVAGFQPYKDGDPLPVGSVWLHSDGKFGFIELQSEQDAVNMMQLNGVFLHGRPLRINRPSDYRPEVHNRNAPNLTPETINENAIMDLCDQLEGLASPPSHFERSATVTHVKTKEEKIVEPPTMGVVNGVNDDVKREMQREQPSVHSSVLPRASSPSGAPTTNGRSTNTAETKSEAEASVESKSDRGDGDVRGSASARRGSTDAEAFGSVISLVNLVTSEDLDGTDEIYEDLVDDVKTECGQYGEVLHVEVPRKGVWKGTAFIEFAKNDHANMAVNALRARVFDGRLISAEIVEGCATAAGALARHKE